MTVTDYRNFDLLIARAGEHYRASVVDSPAGEASIRFDPPFTADEIAGLGGSPGVRRDARPAGEPRPEVDLAAVGRQLFAAVFRDALQTLLSTSLSSVAGEGLGLRLRLRFEQDAAHLANLPWETLYDPVQGQFLGLGEASPIVRYLPLPRSRPALLVEPPLRLLVLLSSPRGLVPLDVEREWQAIQEALAPLEAEGKFVLERLTPPTLVALQDRLLGEPVHVLHFVGHGTFDQESGAGSLALEDAGGELHLVRGDQLAALLRNHAPIRLAYLNACEGALTSGLSAFTGVAQAIVRQGVPAALAMQAEITDAGAITLARTFYTALAAGRPVDAALTQARVALDVDGSREWAIPVLFSRSSDNRLFDIRQVLPTPHCPYPGLVPFSEAQKDFFFGREAEIEQALDSLRLHPFLAVIGPSGSGKSSLVQAGLIPALRRSSTFGPGEWTIHALRPGDGQAQAGQALLDVPFPDQAAGEADGPPTLLFVDQFEEVFTLAGPGQAQAFLDSLQSLIGRPNLYVVLAVRADFYPELMASSIWEQARAHRLELQPLGDDALWAAIVEPAERVGVTVDEALAVQLIADAAGQSGVLPLVQETLVLLWEKVEQRQLRLAAYRRMADGDRSGLQVAIDRRASVVYQGLPAAARPVARRIFLRLIQFGEGRADTRRRQTVDDLRASGEDPVLLDETLARLVESRLLTISGEAGDARRRVDIAHEALIGGWSQLQSWIGRRRAAEQARRALEAKAAEWARRERRGGLLDVYELQEAEQWLAGEHARDLGYSQQLADLVAASREALARAEAEKEAQRRRELEQARELAREQRLRAEEQAAAAAGLRRRAWFALGLSLLAVVAALFAFWQYRIAGQEADSARRAEATAVANRQEADEQRAVAVTAQAETERLYRIALVRLLSAQSRLENGDTALLLALGATTIHEPGSDRPLATAEEALRDRLLQWSYWQQTLGSHAARVRALAYLQDDRFVVSGGQDRRLLLWSAGEVLSPTLLLRTEPGVDVDSLAVAPSRGLLAAGTSDGQVHLFDLLDGARQIDAWQAHEDAASLALAFTPDGQSLVSGGADWLAHLWRLDALDAPAVSWPRDDWVRTVAVSPDGHWLAIGGDDQALALVDLTGPDPFTVVLTDTFLSRVTAASFGPDSASLAAGSEDGTIHVVELHADRVGGVDVLDPPGIASGVLTLSFGPLPAQLLVGTMDGSLLSVDLGAPDQGWAQLASLDSPIDALAVSPSGRAVATGDRRGAVRLWSLQPDAAEPRVQIGHEERVRAFAFVSATSAQAPGQEPIRLISASQDGTLLFWSSSGQVLREIHRPEIPFLTLAVSPDGWLAAGGLDPTVLLWRLDDLDAQPRTLDGHQDAVVSLQFSPDGGWLATGSLDRQILLWDLGDLGGKPLLVGSQQSGVLSLAFSPDGASLAAGDEFGGVYLWPLQGQDRAPQLLAERGDLVRSVTFRPDGRYVASADDGGQVVLTPLDGRSPPQVLSAHEGRARWVAFSPDGTLMATAGDDMLVKLWNPLDLSQEPVTLRGHRAIVRTLAFSPEGGQLASGGDDRLIYLWTVGLHNLQQMACDRVAADLAPEEWQAFFGGEPYRSLCEKEGTR